MCTTFKEINNKQKESSNYFINRTLTAPLNKAGGDKSKTLPKVYMCLNYNKHYTEGDIIEHRSR